MLFTTLLRAVAIWQANFGKWVEDGNDGVPEEWEYLLNICRGGLPAAYAHLKAQKKAAKKAHNSGGNKEASVGDGNEQEEVVEDEQVSNTSILMAALQ